MADIARARPSSGMALFSAENTPRSRAVALRESFFGTLLSLIAFFIPALASAHEVYVLTPAEIAQGLATPPFDWFAVIGADIHEFVFWAFIGVLTVLIIFGISIIRPLERLLVPAFDRLKRYALDITRITVGISFLAPAVSYVLPVIVRPPAAAYGPELPLVNIWGSFTPEIAVFLALIGLLIIFGIWTRAAALAAIILFAINIYVHGLYMLTYTNYFGEIVILLLLGAEQGRRGSGRRSAFTIWLERLGHKVKPYAFLIIRVCFGTSLFYASYYAKLLHNDLALQVASLPLAGHSGSIAAALGFEPHFLVVGAGIVEFVIAIFFILGIEIRFTSLFLLFWLSMSLIYFGEAVWPHIILIGIPIAFIVYGYDKYSIEGWLFKKRKMEPVF